MIVKSIERNAANMYMARLHLLGLKKDDKNFPANCDKKLIESKFLACDEGGSLAKLGKESQWYNHPFVDKRWNLCGNAFHSRVLKA